jgi:hypothetical protein
VFELLRRVVEGAAGALTRVASHDRLVVFRAKANPRDERLFVVGEGRDLPDGEVKGEAPSAPLAFELAFHEAMRALRGRATARVSRVRGRAERYCA